MSKALVTKPTHIPDDISSATWQKIRDWHISNHTTTLQAAFELGDLIVNASITTGLDCEKVIRRLISELGDIAYSNGTYHRCIIIVQKFTAIQRKTLIEAHVPVVKAQILATRIYDGARRSEIITQIGNGRLKSFASIQTNSTLKRFEKTKTLRHGIHNPDDVIGIQVRIKGEFQRNLMQMGLRSLLTQVPQDILLGELNYAVNELRKSGKDLRTFCLESRPRKHKPDDEILNPASPLLTDAQRAKIKADRLVGMMERRP
jgi:hypothetical protein